MNSYNWDEVVKHRNVLRDELDKTDYYINMGREMNENMQLFMRIAGHLSSSLAISAISKTGDPYYLGIYLFCIGVMVNSEDELDINNIIKYIVSKVGDGKTMFNTEFIDSVIRGMYKSVLPFVGGISNEYSNTEVITITDYHIIRLAKLMMTGAMTGVAIRNTIKDDDGKPKSWFHNFQQYVTEVYAEVTSLDNGGVT